jgi:hypothetical protein
MGPYGGSVNTLYQLQLFKEDPEPWSCLIKDGLVPNASLREFVHKSNLTNFMEHSLLCQLVKKFPAFY